MGKSSHISPLRSALWWDRSTSPTRRERERGEMGRRETKRDEEEKYHILMMRHIRLFNAENSCSLFVISMKSKVNSDEIKMIKVVIDRRFFWENFDASCTLASKVVRGFSRRAHHVRRQMCELSAEMLTNSRARKWQLITNYEYFCWSIRTNNKLYMNFQLFDLRFEVYFSDFPWRFAFCNLLLSKMGNIITIAI